MHGAEYKQEGTGERPAAGNSNDERVGGFFLFKDTVDIYFDTSIQFLLSNHFKFSSNITSVALHTRTRTQHAEKRGFVL